MDASLAKNGRDSLASIVAGRFIVGNRIIQSKGNGWSPLDQSAESDNNSRT